MELNSYSGLPNERVKAANGIDYAYRDTGPTDDGADVPLVLLQHFRGNLDNWDPALIDALAPARRVIAFDNAGVGGSGGTTPNTADQMAHDAIAFIEAIGALGLGQGPVDVLGFSLGSFVAQQIALTRLKRSSEGWSSPLRRRRAPTACTAGPLRSSTLSATLKPAPRNT
ncbi:alpha/beta fold hydrolase [Streptomyces sp. S1D4-11]